MTRLWRRLPLGRVEHVADERIDDAVLRATIELLEEVGYLQLTIAAIAERAGTNKPAIYRRWPTKAHLVHEAVFPAQDLDALPLGDDLRGDIRTLVVRRTSSSSVDRRPVRRCPGLLAETVGDPCCRPSVLGRAAGGTWEWLQRRLDAGVAAGRGARATCRRSTVFELIAGTTFVATAIRPLDAGRGPVGRRRRRPDHAGHHPVTTRRGGARPVDLGLEGSAAVVTGGTQGHGPGDRRGVRRRRRPRRRARPGDRGDRGHARRAATARQPRRGRALGRPDRPGRHHRRVRRARRAVGRDQQPRQHGRARRRLLRGARRRRVGRGAPARPDGGGPLHPGGAPAAAGRRVGSDRELRRPLDPAAEPADRRLHGVEGGGRQRVEEPGQEPRRRRDPREHDQPRDDRDGQLHRGARTRSSPPTGSTRATRSTS